MVKLTLIHFSLLTDNWCFLDAKWTSRIYRIDNSQEYLLKIRDVLEGGIFVLDLHDPTAIDEPIPTTTPQKTPTTLRRHREGTTKTSDNDEDVILEERPITRHSMSFDLSCLSELTSTKGDGLSDFTSYNAIDSDDTTDDDACVHSDTSGDESDTTTTTTTSSTSENRPLRVPSDVKEREQILLKAAKFGNLDTVREIHAAGTGLCSRDARGRTPLHLAAKYGHKELVAYIAERLDPDALNLRDNETGHTPLHLAALYKRRTVCRTLVLRGGSATLTDRDGNTPRQLAMSSNSVYPSQDLQLSNFLKWHERLQEIASDHNSTAV